MLNKLMKFHQQDPWFLPAE